MVEILLVTEVPWVVNEVSAALADAKYSVSVEDDPRAVADAIGSTGPDVVLVDMQTGSMGGMAVTRSIRDATATGEVDRPRVIMLLDRDADAFLAGRSGADAWVRKPLSSGDLRAAVEPTEVVEAS